MVHHPEVDAVDDVVDHRMLHRERALEICVAGKDHKPDPVALPDGDEIFQNLLGTVRRFRGWKSSLDMEPDTSRAIMMSIPRFFTLE